MTVTHFFTGLTTASNNSSVASDSFKLFRWVLYKTELRLHELDSNTFYKIHFHNENQLIETESSSQGDSWLYSRHFSSGLIPYINHFHYGNNIIQFSKWKSSCWWLAISVATNGGNAFFHWSYLHHPHPINTPQFLGGRSDGFDTLFI